jgi:hypothetical protein
VFIEPWEEQNRHFPALRAKVTDFGVPEHHGDGSALPVLVQSGNLSLEIWSSDGCWAVNNMICH